MKTKRLARNPAGKDASPPTAKQAKAPEMHPWTAGQLAAFLGWAREHAPGVDLTRAGRFPLSVRPSVRFPPMTWIRHRRGPRTS